MQRPCGVTQQESQGDQVECDAECSPDAVVARAVRSFNVLDWKFDYSHAVARQESGYEPVHLAVEIQVFDDFASVGFEGRSEIVYVDSADL